MSSSNGPAPTSAGRRRPSAAQVIIVSSVMFTFISFWRTAAIVLGDLGSTAFYIGGIVEQSIGKAAPWFILAVMIFSGAVGLVYIESAAMFVRGGVYRVVREAMGGAVAKVSVSALMFDYILTGPISAVSAGQYIVSLVLELLGHFLDIHVDHPDAIKAWGAVFIAIAITLYFFRQNVVGIHESSEKALRIVIALAVMGVLILAWSGVTLWLEGPRNSIPMAPNFKPTTAPELIAPADPLGFVKNTSFGDALRNMGPRDWFSLVGFLGIFVAFGHSILAMSGLETLAQVYREVESPKLRNFKRAAAIVLLFSLVLTGSVSFLAVAIIPDDVRMVKYADNLIGGLAMHMAGPTSAQLLLNAFVVIAGFLALSGAVNTSIIGSNGVMNRVAEDGVVPDWFLRPHPRYGTTYRVLTLITGLQFVVILASRGDVLLLGEAYAFGVVWSFVFMTASMLVLRFTDKTPREFKVPLNLRIGKVELPIGLALIFIVLAISAVMNALTKEVATTWGVAFTSVFLAVFTLTEQYNLRGKLGGKHQHLEQFNRQLAKDVLPETLDLDKSYRKLVGHPLAQ